MTSIEWLIEQLEQKGDMRETPSIRNLQLNIDTSDYLELKRQAKEIHKQEIVDAFSHTEIMSGEYFQVFDNAEDYYQETFVSNESDATPMERKLLKSGFVDIVPKQSDVREVVEDDVEKLAVEEYPIYDGDLLGIANNQKHSRIDFIKGYNKAKETLYTEKQVREAIDKAYYVGAYVEDIEDEDTEEIIQSLKQPKKD
jgi:hypothetical protein